MADDNPHTVLPNLDDVTEREGELPPVRLAGEPARLVKRLREKLRKANSDDDVILIALAVLQAAEDKPILIPKDDGDNEVIRLWK